MKYIFFILLLTPSAHALEVILDRTNHLGLRMTDVIIQDSSRYIFNGKDLGTKIPSSVLQSINELEATPKQASFKSDCRAGQFIYVKKDKKKTVRRTGCTEGSSYGQMIKNLEVLRNFAKGK